MQPVNAGIKNETRFSILGFLVNLALALTKCFAGGIGHSLTLAADGVESLRDVVSSALEFAIKPPGGNDPHRRAKAQPIAAIVVSLALMAASVSITRESISRVNTPHGLPAGYTLAVLIGVAALKALLSRYAGEAGTEIENTATKEDAWHHLGDTIISGLAFFGITIGLLTNDPASDAWAALCASQLVLFNGIRQMAPAILELLGRTPSATWREDVPRERDGGGRGWDGKPLDPKNGFQSYLDLHIPADHGLYAIKGYRTTDELKQATLPAQPQAADLLVHTEASSDRRW